MTKPAAAGAKPAAAKVPAAAGAGVAARPAVAPDDAVDVAAPVAPSGGPHSDKMAAELLLGDDGAARSSRATRPRSATRACRTGARSWSCRR